jgi:hypothetical protein
LPSVTASLILGPIKATVIAIEEDLRKMFQIC